MNINENNYQKEVIESEIPVILDFWASWCGPCKMLAPIIEEIEKEYAGKIKVGKVNVDEEMALSMQFGVSSIPMVALMKNGKIEKRTVGFMPKSQLLVELGIE